MSLRHTVRFWTDASLVAGVLLSSSMVTSSGHEHLDFASQRSPVRSAGLVCEGAGTMQALVASWMRAARAEYPGETFALVKGTHFSAAGVRAVLEGRANCVTFAREPFPAEVHNFSKRFGSGPIMIPVAQGSYRTPHGTFAIAVYVNHANPLRRLTMRQLRLVLGDGGRGRGAITGWGALGLGGAWRNRPIHVYGMTPYRASGNPPGIVNFLDLRVLRGTSWRPDLRVQTDTAQRSALTGIVRDVGRDPDGIGFSGIGYATPAVASLALSRGQGGPFFAPTAGNVVSARYPLSRTIYLGFPPSLPMDAHRDACALLAVALGARGQAIVRAGRMRFGPLTRGQLHHARRRASRELGCTLATAATMQMQATPRRASNTIRIVGYNDMAAIFRAWDSHFTRRHPQVRFELVLHGTRTAPMALARGWSLLAPMGAPFSDRQLRRYRAVRHADPVAFRVAHASNDPRALSSPLGIFVNAGNPLHAITLRQVARVLTHRGADSSMTWGELGVKGPWARRYIDPCGLAPSTALGQYMARHVLHGRAYTGDFLAFSESSAVVLAAASDPNALCFADLNHQEHGAKRLRISAAAGTTQFTGTRDEIQSGAYPLDRYLYIYVRRAVRSKFRNSLLCQYLKMVLSPEGQRLLAKAPPSYIPLNARQLHAEQAKLALLRCARPCAAAGSNRPE